MSTAATAQCPMSPEGGASGHLGASGGCGSFPDAHRASIWSCIWTAVPARSGGPFAALGCLLFHLTLNFDLNLHFDANFGPPAWLAMSENPTAIFTPDQRLYQRTNWCFSAPFSVRDSRSPRWPNRTIGVPEALASQTQVFLGQLLRHTS